MSVCPKPLRLVALLCLVAAMLVHTSLFAQLKMRANPTHSLEFRIASPTVVEVEYGWRALPFLSADFLFQGAKTGPVIGMTLDPLKICFLQMRVGYPLIEGDQVADGPQRVPDLMYAYRLGLSLPSRDARVFFILSFGKLWIVDRDFCYTCGGFPPPGAPPLLPKQRDEYEIYDLFSIGIGGTL